MNIKEALEQDATMMAFGDLLNKLTKDKERLNEVFAEALKIRNDLKSYDTETVRLKQHIDQLSKALVERQKQIIGGQR